MRPPRIMLRNLVDLSLGQADRSTPPLLGPAVTALFACMTFAMLTITYGAGAALGVITPVLHVSGVPASPAGPGSSDASILLLHVESCCDMGLYSMSVGCRPGLRCLARVALTVAQLLTIPGPGTANSTDKEWHPEHAVHGFLVAMGLVRNLPHKHSRGHRA